MSCDKSVDVEFLGTYDYKIFDESLHRTNSYLSEDSYGYVITNLDLKPCGIEIIGVGKLNKNDEYLVTINYPITEVKTNSKRIRNEGVGNTSKKPIEVILDKKVYSNKVFIYKITPKGQYRLLQG